MASGHDVIMLCSVGKGNQHVCLLSSALASLVWLLLSIVLHDGRQHEVDDMK